MGLHSHSDPHAHSHSHPQSQRPHHSHHSRPSQPSHHSHKSSHRHDASPHPQAAGYTPDSFTQPGRSPGPVHDVSHPTSHPGHGRLHPSTRPITPQRHHHARSGEHLLQQQYYQPALRSSSGIKK